MSCTNLKMPTTRKVWPNAVHKAPRKEQRSGWTSGSATQAFSGWSSGRTSKQVMLSQYQGPLARIGPLTAAVPFENKSVLHWNGWTLWSSRIKADRGQRRHHYSTNVNYETQSEMHKKKPKRGDLEPKWLQSLLITLHLNVPFPSRANQLPLIMFRTGSMDENSFIQTGHKVRKTVWI